jgi:predicted GNAT family N-acyltransferase
MAQLNLAKKTKMVDELSIQKFNVREADWAVDGDVLSNIRRLVFIIEQNVPQEEEWDGKDEDSWHWLATEPDGSPIGTARLLPDGQIGRMAVMEKCRGRGVGAALLERAVIKARHLEFTSVSLNAQTHARTFYERAGFKLEGEEFEEAGIPHIKMIQTLAPLDDNVQRLAAVEADDDLSVKQFDTSEVSFEQYKKIIRNIREVIFVHELGLPDSLISDDQDETSIHWVAQDTSSHVIGVLRMSVEGEISRLAVMTEGRNIGVGHSLLELATNKALRFGLPAVRLDALATLGNFYEKAGFHKKGEAFDGFGLEHQTYVKDLESEDVHEMLRRPDIAGDHYSESDVIYKLGEDKSLILLRREEDFRNVILEMAKQARISIQIYSPVLDHKLFNNNELMEICSALARKNRYTHIEVLLHDSHRVVKNGHALLSISRKLSSSIQMKIVHPEYRQLNHEYMLVDGVGLIYRLDYEEYEGYSNFSDKTECNRLGRQFNAAWESGLNDPNLRQLRI